MRYYVWDKESNVAGVSAAYLIFNKPEFAEEPVIGIIDKYGILLHFETMRSLQNKYKVWSNIPDVVGKEVIEKLKNGYDLQPNGLVDNLDETARVYLEATMYDVRFDDARYNDLCARDGIKVPCDCKVTTIEGDDAVEKSLTVMIENIGFIDQPLENIYGLTIMRRFKERADVLKDRIKVAMEAQNEDDVNTYTEELEELGKDIFNMDVTLNIDALAVYEYEKGFTMIKTKDGQTVIIDNICVSSCKHNSIEYERETEDGTRKRVNFETIYVRLQKSIDSELREIDDTVYITY